MSKSKPSYLHQVSTKSIQDDKVTIHEESIIDGPKGLTFKMFHQEGDKREKITGRRKEDGTVVLKHTKNGNTEEKEMSLSEFKEFVKKQKSLKFALEYVSDLKGGKRRRKGSRASSKKGSRKRSRKGSKKGSKKGSRKRSRKASRSRKRSRKGSKKRSRKGSKKRSRKGSKKGSRKRSRKTSRSRKRSRKGSKKGSRKGSKRRSRRRSRK